MKELFYVKGDPTNPEGAKDALLEKYPNAESSYVGMFNCEEYLYYINESNDIVETHYESNLGEILKRFGTEIFPKKQQEFEEKTLYQPIFRKMDKNNMKLYYYESDFLSETIQEALNCDPDVYGYKEVKIKILKK